MRPSGRVRSCILEEYVRTHFGQKEQQYEEEEAKKKKTKKTMKKKQKEEEDARPRA